MRITQKNFKESFNSLKSKEGKNRVYYKLISFKTQTNYQGINFKLAPNILLAVLTFFCICSVSILFFVILLKIKLEGLIYVLFVVAVGYISYKLSVTLTEKIFRKQISEFSKLINNWKRESK